MTMIPRSIRALAYAAMIDAFIVGGLPQRMTFGYNPMAIA